MAKKKNKKQNITDVVTDDRNDVPLVDQGSSSTDTPQRPRTSPYTRLPVELNVGPDGVLFHVPRHILPVEWSKTGLEKRLILADVDPQTGHTLVHYLYTKAYETLDVVAEIPAFEIRNDFTQALLVYIMTVRYNGLGGLQELAIEEMKDLGSRLTIFEVLGAIKDHFSKLESSSWIHDYVRQRANVAFAADCTIFQSTKFLEIVGNADYDKFIIKCVIDTYDERIAHMADAEELLSEKLRKQIHETLDTSVRGDDPEEPKQVFEDVISPHINEVVEVKDSQNTSEQCSILTEDLSTIESLSLEYAVDFRVEEASPFADSRRSDLSVVEHPDDEPQAVWQNDGTNVQPEDLAAEAAEKEDRIQLPRINVEAFVNSDSRKAALMSGDGAAAEVGFGPEHVSDLGIGLDQRLQPCLLQADHMLEEKLWKKCKQCQAVLHKLALQLAWTS